MRALIVEDEPHIAEALAYLLEREGFAVTALVDGSQADPTTLAHYDIVLLDVMLPGRSGFEIAAAAMAVAARPKICVLTARGQAEDRARMEAIGVDAFVTKPFANRELIAIVRELVGR